MKSYYRIILGRHNAYAKTCFEDGFIGGDFSIRQDLTPDLPEDWRQFNQKFIPIYQKLTNIESKVSAGLACGALWTISKGLKIGDIVLCPDGESHYHVGEVVSDYQYASAANAVLPHRRDVRWLPQVIDRSAMSEPLQNSTGSVGTVSNVTSYADELVTLIGTDSTTAQISTPDSSLVAAAEKVEEAVAFRMEKFLEEFLIENWAQTPLGSQFDIYQDNGELIGRQYQTDTGPLDILAISKDKKTLLVVELKKGRPSDDVVGQILRYMGYVQDVLAKADQEVKGAVIALEDDVRVRRALRMVPTIAFYRYQITFKLNPVMNQ